MSHRSIDAHELASVLAADAAVVLIDVRSPAEFAAVHVTGARNLPLHRLDPEELVAGFPKGPIHLICQSGSRAAAAAERLADVGCTRVRVVAGGTEACIAAGVPLQRGRQGLSLQRQVQLVVGIGLLAASALAWWHHPAWLLATAGFGAGLTVAGLSGTCGLALVLARMPWNQRGPRAQVQRSTPE